MTTTTTLTGRFASAVLLLLILLLTLLAAATCVKDRHRHHADQNECVYTVYVRTGSIIKAGTDAKIGLTVQDATGKGIAISDLKSWGGLMSPDHDYFERGALDVFSGRGPCGLTPPLCKLNVTSDGSGSHHGWYCETVEVTTTGPHVPCSQTLFFVRQWLATDAPPYELYATVDGCGPTVAHGRAGRKVGFGRQVDASM